jgi:hypothetical protein
VHRHLGPGYLESVYEEALAVELTLHSIPFERRKPISINENIEYRMSNKEYRIMKLNCTRLTYRCCLSPTHSSSILAPPFDIRNSLFDIRYSLFLGVLAVRGTRR